MGCLALLIVIANLLFSCDGQYNWEQIQKNSIKARTLPQPNICGLLQTTFETKIINGKPAKLGAYPWMANLGYVSQPNQSPKWLCAGSLISNRYVLTAAHCIDPKLVQAKGWNLTTVRLGDLDLDPSVNDGANPVDYEIENQLFHEKFDDDRKLNDIGLIRLKEEVIFTAFIRPICLPTSEFQIKDFVGFSPVVAGWGKSIKTNSRPGTQLLEAEVEIKNTSSCSASITSVLRKVVIDKRVICASSPGKDACQGDSGGPLMFYRRLENTPPNSNGNLFLMGIVSYGYSCALEEYPGVYTRVTEYMPWIIDKMDI